MGEQIDIFAPPIAHTAAISPDGRYRYNLARRWKSGLPILWIMLNPSTADAFADDPTIRRCVGFSRAWGHFGIEVVNLFALRSTDPRNLVAVPDPIGPDNDRWIREAADRSGIIVCAWGARGGLLGRDREVLSILAGSPLFCLGVTRGGNPRHPLYLPACAELRPMPGTTGG